MIHKKPSEYAGKTVKLKPTVTGWRGKLFEVEDYWDRVDGKSWMACVGNIAVLIYSIRAGASNNLGITIPLDNEVLYGKIDGYGALIHVCELDTENGEVASLEEVEKLPMVKCPECLSKTSHEELKMFGGMCDQCNQDLPF